MSPDLEPPAGQQTESALLASLRELTDRVRTLESSVQRGAERVDGDLAIVTEALGLIHDDDPRARRELQQLRDQPGYGEAFSSSDPLVSVVIPTWNRIDTLIDRAIPSALAQTHANVEVIVVGDASSTQTAEAVAAVEDPRVVFHNLTVRGPYPQDPARSWLVSGTPGFNAGVALARGHWIAPLGDDDAFVPEHVERLLAVARERRLEFVYGQIRMILPDGRESLVGEFPPRLTQVGLQSALYLRGLRFLELELGHALFGKPNDWGLVHRMMRAGVRMGMVDEVSVNYWPSLRAQTEHRETGQPGEDAANPDTGASDQASELNVRLHDVEARLTGEQARSHALEAQLLDLDRRFKDVRDSRSWRITAPLRALRRRARSGQTST